MTPGTEVDLRLQPAAAYLYVVFTGRFGRLHVIVPLSARTGT